MARARLLKPGFFTNDRLAEVSAMGRLLFAGLWTLADREGRLEDRAKRIKGELFPYESVNVERLLGELAERGFITRYESDSLRIIQIMSFTKHQSPHPKEPASRLPAMGETAASRVLVTDKTVTSPAVAVAGSSVAVADPAATGSADAAAAGAFEDLPEPHDDYRKICDAWFVATGTTLPPATAERFEARAETLGVAVVLAAIRETGDNGAKSPKYTLAILERWEAEGRTGPDEKPAAPPRVISHIPNPFFDGFPGAPPPPPRKAATS